MTDNKQPNTPQAERERAEHRLSPELDIAVGRVCQHQPQPDAIARCISNAKRLNETPQTQPRSVFRPVRFARPMAIAGSLVAAAAAVYAMVTWNAPTEVPEHRGAAAPSLSLPVYSPITQLPLVEVGYRRIEADLDQAEAELEQASEAIALAAVRHEVQQTLEEFYDWSEPGE